MEDTQTIDKQTLPPGGSASASAAGAAQAQGTPTAEQITAAFREHPELLQQVKRPLKLNGREVEASLSDVETHAQKVMAANQTWEEAKQMREEAVRLKAEATGKGDPIELLRQAFEPLLKPKPAAPVNPLDALRADPTQFVDPAAVATAAWESDRRVGETVEQLRARVEQQKLDNDKAIADLRKEQSDREAWQELDKEFAVARAANPLFTAQVIRNTKGEPDIDWGAEPELSRETFRLVKASDVPDARLGGRVAKALGFAETAKLLDADYARRRDERARAEATAREAARRDSAGGGVIPSAQATPIPAEIASQPDEINGKPNAAKADAIAAYWRSVAEGG